MFAVIDIGSSKIKTLIGSIIEDESASSQNKLNVLGVGVVTSSGIRKGAILDMEEFKKDIDASLREAENMAQNGLSLQNQTILKIIPETFSVDLENFIKSPVGMAAKKLEVNAHIFTVSSNVIANIKKGFEDIGLTVIDMYPTLLAAPEAVLSRRQKELGVACIDIGASTTSITVYEE
jgi:cell division protein FtsA